MSFTPSKLTSLGEIEIFATRRANFIRRSILLPFFRYFDESVVDANFRRAIVIKAGDYSGDREIVALISFLFPSQQRQAVNFFSTAKYIAEKLAAHVLPPRKSALSRKCEQIKKKKLLALFSCSFKRHIRISSSF